LTSRDPAITRFYGLCDKGTCIQSSPQWSFICSSQCQCSDGTAQGQYVSQPECRTTVGNREIAIGSGNCTATAPNPIALAGNCSCPDWKCVQNDVKNKPIGSILTADQYTTCSNTITNDISYQGSCGNGDLSQNPYFSSSCYSDFIQPNFLCLSPIGEILPNSSCEPRMKRPYFTTGPQCTVETGCQYYSYMCANERFISTPSQFPLLSTDFSLCNQADLTSFFNTCNPNLNLPSLETGFTSLNQCNGTKQRKIYCVGSQTPITTSSTSQSLTWHASNYSSCANPPTQLVLPVSSIPCDICSYSWSCAATSITPPDSSPLLSQCLPIPSSTTGTIWYDYLEQFECNEAIGKRSVQCTANIHALLPPSSQSPLPVYLYTRTDQGQLDNSKCISLIGNPPQSDQNCPINGTWWCLNDDQTWSENTCNQATIQSHCVANQNVLTPLCTRDATAAGLPIYCRINNETVADKYCLPQKTPPTRSISCSIDTDCTFEWKCTRPVDWINVIVGDNQIGNGWDKLQDCNLPFFTQNQANNDQDYTQLQTQYLHDVTYDGSKHPWSQCSNGCGSGIQKTTIFCTNKEFKIVKNA
jgi:hypothetical protein